LAGFYTMQQRRKAMSEETITTWRGQNVEDMPHDELLKAFKQLGKMYQNNLQEHDRQFKFLAELRKH